MTKSTINGMTDQQVYDKVVGHMRAQGNPWGSFLTNRPWGYINPDNPCERCAVGILMDVRLVAGRYTPIQKVDSEFNYIYHTELTNALQWIFEEEAQSTWEEQFEIVAKRFDLEYNKPKSVPKEAEEIVEKVESCTTL